VGGVRAEARRRRFQKALEPESTLHRCSLCGRTEVSDPDLEFRVSANGSEYCGEHLPSKRGSGN
jgi:hypothetical protein